MEKGRVCIVCGEVIGKEEPHILVVRKENGYGIELGYFHDACIYRLPDKLSPYVNSDICHMAIGGRSPQ